MSEEVNYTYDDGETVSVADVLNADITADDLVGNWTISTTTSPIGWADWSKKVMWQAWSNVEDCFNTIVGWWAFGNPDDDASTSQMKAALSEIGKTTLSFDADGNVTIIDALNSYVDGKYVADTINTTYTVADGYIRFADTITLSAASVTLKGVEMYTLNVTKTDDGTNENALVGGIWLAQDNTGKQESSAIHLMPDFKLGGGLFSSETWAGDWNKNVLITGNGNYTAIFNISGDMTGLYVDFYNVLAVYPNFSATITSIVVDGAEMNFDAEKLSVGTGDSTADYRIYINNPWADQATESALSVTEKVEVNVTISGME